MSFSRPRAYIGLLVTCRGLKSSVFTLECI